MPSKTEREYIENLEQFTESLENLVDLLEKQHKKGKNSLNDMTAATDGKKLKTLSDDMVTLVKTTKKIDSRTQEILAEVKSARKAKEGGIFQKTSDKENKKKVIDGVKLIVLIALGVLAIGMAFKLVGTIDPVSVLALSTAIFIIANTFEKLSKVKDLTIKKAMLISGIMIILSAAIMLSSFFLMWVSPISIVTAFSIIAVGATLGIAAWLLVKAFEKLDITKPKVLKNIMLMPLLLPIISLAIVLSSFILSLTQPITLAQGLSALGVGAILGIAAYLLLTGLKGRDLSDPKTVRNILLMPLLLPLIATSIVLSSVILNFTAKITPEQGITALLVGGIIGGAAFLLLNAVKGQDLSNKQTIKSILLMPLLLPAISLAIVASSWILQYFKPLKDWKQLLGNTLAITAIMLPFVAMIWAINKFGISYKDILNGGLLVVAVTLAIVGASYILQYFQPLKTDPWQMIGHSLAIGLATIAFFPSIYLINKFGIDVKDILKAGLSIIALSTVIVLSSWILSVGKYDTKIPVDWVIGVGLSILTFSVFVFGLGALMTTGVGDAALGLGIVAVPLVALTIVASSLILSLGKYTGGPTVEWSKGVGLSLLAFVPAMIVAGVGIAGIILGAPAMLLVALTIVKVSEILSSGKYSGGPSMGWALSLGLLLPVFTSSLLALGVIGILGAPIILAGTLLMLGIAKAIVKTSEILASGTYVGGPSKEWSEGVGLAIGAFANALGVAMNSGKSLMNKIFGGGGITPEQFVTFITTVSEGIKTAGQTLGSGTFSGGPTKEWSEGVGVAIGAFSTALSVAMDSGKSVWQKMFGGGGITPEQFVTFITTVSQGIKTAADVFKGNEGTYTGGPSSTWSEGVGGAISAFSNALSTVNQSDMDGQEFIDFVKSLTTAIKNVAIDFSTTKFGNVPNTLWIEGIKTTLNGFIDITKNISENTLDNIDTLRKLSSKLNSDIIPDLVESSTKIGTTTWVLLPPAWINSMINSLEIFRRLESVKIGFTTTSIYDVASQLSNAANSISKGDWSKYPSKKWVSSMTDMVNLIVLIGNTIDDKKIESLNKFSDAVKDLSYSFKDLSNSGIDKISNLTTTLNVLTQIDTRKLDGVVKSLDQNKLALQNAVSTITNSQNSTGSMLDSFKDIFGSIIPKKSDQSRVSTDKKEGEQATLKVDNKDITDRLDQINKNLQTLIELSGGKTKGGSITKMDIT